jgi:hypothetical protein
MIAVLDLEFTERVNRSRWPAVGCVANDGKGLKRFAGVIDSAQGDAARA